MIERCLELDQPGRAERLALEPGQNLGEQREVMGRFACAVRDLFGALAESQIEKRIDEDDGERHLSPTSPARCAPGDEARNRERGQQRDGDAGGRLVECRRAFAPFRQRPRARLRAHLFAQDRQVFAQVQPRSQFADRGMTRAQHFGRAGGAQPIRQRLLAGAGT